ncbi:hypothetical protein [Actinomadura algeriensis]|uniref:Uncharacterized protein n=1 Tax=Actinomadura algeriensis TaxID=1679523 RepID=A0ABR9JYU2_9ACTN|nr:hypothetical protein [Actinomadura algeriensis]MBE1535747.1 hypothetical protein [Actinomadura algeriensis]
MGNTVRWTLFALLVAVNVGTSVTLQDTWYEIVIGVVTGVGAIALVIDYLVRGRRHGR